MENVSEAYNLIHNLNNAAWFHKRKCDISCDVSVSQIRTAAARLIHLAYESEKSELKNLVSGMPNS
jgi:hypothetical protein